MHEMIPSDSKNIDYLKNEFEAVKSYGLYYARFNDGKISSEPNWDYTITKTELNIRQAWEIGENDVDSVGIYADDNPIIPSNIKDIPVVNLIKKKKEYEKK